MKGQTRDTKGVRTENWKLEVLTNNEERFDDNIADHGRPVGVDEARVIGNNYCHVKGCNENQPIPAGFEATVMTKNKLRFFDR